MGSKRRTSRTAHTPFVLLKTTLLFTCKQQCTGQIDVCIGVLIIQGNGSFKTLNCLTGPAKPLVGAPQMKLRITTAGISFESSKKHLQ